MAPLPPIDLPALALDFMNADHAEAVHLLTAVVAQLEAEPVDAAALAGAWRAFVEHNREHFGREEVVMQQGGFPPYPVHKAEHDRMLAALDALAENLAGAGGLGPVRAMAQQEFPAWLDQHVRTMDFITARWLASQRGR